MAFFASKSTEEFEVLVHRDGRWTMDTLASYKSEALAQGERQLRSGRFDAVKVIAIKRRADGTSIDTVIWHETREITKRDDTIKLIGSAADGAPPCESLGALRGPTARLIIGRMFREFLQRNRVTATEMMYSESYLRALDRVAEIDLVQQAVGLVAAAQAAAQGSRYDTKIINARREALAALVAKHTYEVRLIGERTRTLPKWNDAAPLDQYAECVRVGGSPGAGGLVFIGALIERLSQEYALVTKGELLLELYQRCRGTEAASAIEGILADLMGCSLQIEEVIGATGNLEDAIDQMLRALRQMPLDPLQKGSLVFNYQTMFASDGAVPALPEPCATVLTARAIIALESPLQLVGRGQAEETEAVRRLTERATLPDGTRLGGEAMDKALNRRLKRIRLGA